MLPSTHSYYECPVDKPYDRLMKGFVDESPLAFLTLLEILPPDPRIRLEVHRQEAAAPVLLPDFIATVTLPDGTRYVIHLEFYLDYRERQVKWMARYGLTLMLKHDCSVYSWLVLIRPAPPRDIPTVARLRHGGTECVHPFQVIRLWEVPVAPILADDPALHHLLAMTPGMSCDSEALGQALAKLVASGNEARIAQFTLMMGLRYNESGTEERIMSFAEAVWEGSWVAREAEKVMAEAEAKGQTIDVNKAVIEGFLRRVQGAREQRLREDDARDLLKRALAKRFPGLEAMPELDGILHQPTLESLLLDYVLTATEPATVKEAIRHAAATAPCPY